MNVDLPLQVMIAALKQILPTIDSSQEQTNAIFLSRILAQLAAHSKSRAVAEWETDVPYEDFGGASHYRNEEQRLMSQLLPQWTQMRPAIAQMVEWEAGILTDISTRITNLLRVEEAVSEDADEGQYAERIQAYLRGRFPESADLRVRSFKPFSGGSSKLSAALHVTECRDLPTKLVFRQDRALNVTGGPSVVNEFALLRKVHQLGLKVPKPHLVEASAEPLGAPFLIVSRVAGSPPLNDGLGLYAPHSTSLVFALAGQLAKLHGFAVERFDDVFASLAPPSQDDVLAQLDEFERTWAEHAARPSISMRSAFTWLRQNIALATQGPASIVHRDAMFQNILAQGDRLTSLLDWEFACVGFAAEDLGWCRSVVETRVPWRDFVAAYERAGGRAIPPEQIDFYTIWGAVRLNAMCALANAFVSSNSTRDIRYVAVPFHVQHVALQRLAMQLSRVL